MNQSLARVTLGTAAALIAGTFQALAQSPPRGPQNLSTGDAARLYASACAPCHGRAGDGDSRVVPRLAGTPPRDFTTGVYKFRSTPSGSIPTDEDLFRTISRGVPGTWMPAWERNLTNEERWALVRYLKGLSDRFGDEHPDPSIRVPEDPGVSPQLVEEGRFVYAVLGCGRCHGDAGRGNGPSANELEDDEGNRIRPYDLTSGTYKNGTSPVAIYRTLVTGFSGTPMPAYEPSVAAFAGDEVDPAALVGLVETDIPSLIEYLSAQPGAAELRSTGSEQLDELGMKRLWALVHYLRSLRRAAGPLEWLFGVSPDLTQDEGNPER